MAAVLTEGLVKRFRSHDALRGVDLAVPRGSVLGLLGPNGAGKTTTVRILATLLRPDGGRAEIDGLDVVREPQRVRARIGLTGQYAAVDERLTGRENLEHVGRLFHLGGRAARTRAAELLARFDLLDAAGRPTKGYSGGMRRRLDIAMSLVARPSVLFLDEPTTGLDPRSRLAMWDLIEELGREGTTTLLTTQYLEEAERLADEVVVIDHGAVIARGTPDQLKADIGGVRLDVTVVDPADVEAAVTALAPLATGPPTPHPSGRSFTLPVTDAPGLVPAAVRALDAQAVASDEVAVHRPTLDDVFLQLTGHHVDEAGGVGVPS
jgi:ABC-2 type transport system ATP-binding protein